MKVLIDTSVALSFFVEETHTKKAEEILLAVLDRDIEGYINPLIMAETCGAISRRAGKEAAERAINTIQEWADKGVLGILPQTEETLRAALGLCIEYGIKGADALIAATAKTNHCSLATFDEELRKKLSKAIDIY